MGKQNRARSKDKKPIDLGRLWTLTNLGFHLALGCPTRWLSTFSFSIDWKVPMWFSLSGIGSLPLSTRIKIHEVFIVWSKSGYPKLPVSVHSYPLRVSMGSISEKEKLTIGNKDHKEMELDAYCWRAKIHRKLKLGILCSPFSHLRGLWPH